MGISVEAYRASIGTFVLNCIKRDKFILLPSNIFYNDGNHNFSYFLHEWSYILHTRNKYVQIKAKFLICKYIGVSLFIHMLMALCNDVHPNPGPTPNLSDLNICHCNIRSIKAENKLFFVKNELGGKFDIITCSETWLSDQDNSEKFQIENYQLPFRKDRTIGRQSYGGVLAWVSSRIGCKRRKDLENDELEAMWLEICTVNRKLFLCVVYRAESNTDNTFWDSLQENINNIV